MSEFGLQVLEALQAELDNLGSQVATFDDRLSAMNVRALTQPTHPGPTHPVHPPSIPTLASGIPRSCSGGVKAVLDVSPG